MSGSYEITVFSSLHTYGVKIGHHVLHKEEHHTDVIVLVDATVIRLFPFLHTDTEIVIDALEKNKTLIMASQLIEHLKRLNATKQIHLLAIGGGIVQDLVTFVASTYMRGVSWTYCPTTLLSMVDSCIGGKSSINVGPYKNIAGNFYPPEKIVIDLRFYETLSTVQKVEGLCEAVKITFADSGDAFLHYLELSGKDPLFSDTDTLCEMIHFVLGVKKKFIEEDEFDKGIRLLLNFGHTFGHALEGASDYEISHGVAVGLGILVAFSVSEKFGFVLKDNRRAGLLIAYVLNLFSHVPNLYETCRALDLKRVMDCFRSDKKHTSTHFVMILFDENGFLVRRKLERTEAVESAIVASFECLHRGVYEI